MAGTESESGIPPGFKLRHTLRGHTGVINRIAWSPDGRMVASASDDKSVRLWETGSGRCIRKLQWHLGSVRAIAWSPSGRTVASAAAERHVRLWDTEDAKQVYCLELPYGTVAELAWHPSPKLGIVSDGHRLFVWDSDTDAVESTFRACRCLAWSPDGRTLGLDSEDGLLLLASDHQRHLRIPQPESPYGASSIAWYPDGRLLAVGRGSGISLREARSGRVVYELESPIGYVCSLAFSADGRVLAAEYLNGEVEVWRCDVWERVAVFSESVLGRGLAFNLAFHPTAPVLATITESGCALHIWDIDMDALLGAPAVPTVHYTNAKVVLVGETSAGKTCLSRALMGEPFEPQESTHGRRVWTFDSRQVDLGDSRKETRETLLWDLAGQPGYRMIHQLHLNEVAVALVVFDARSETDPFAGVHHWDRALRQALRVQGGSAPPLKKFLVAARTDRQGIAASEQRIQAMVRELGFDGYFTTSAKEGWEIAELAERIREAVDWDTQPKVSSTELFQTIKQFLLQEKEAGRLLSTAEDLFRAFLTTQDKESLPADIREQFETCIGRVEARGIIQRLSFGKLVLLQPELLDAYASSIVNAAKEEPDGMGCILEEDALAGRFKMSADERIKDSEQEKLLLIATVEELLRHEIALREQGAAGPILVFPSQFTRDWPEAPDPKGKTVIFRFEGPVLNIYATLAVRLSYSGLCEKPEMWKNTALFPAKVGGLCGIWLREIEDGRAELTLFHDDAASEETRYQFEEYVRTHLERKALPETLTRRRIFTCPECDTEISDDAATKRRERDFDWIECNVCETRISLLDREERLVAAAVSTVAQMDETIDAQRDLAAAASVLQGKIETDDFDVFLAHNSKDKPQVEQIAEQLKKRGLYPWIDKEQIPPGRWWQEFIQDAIPQVKSAAIIIGPYGLGRWEAVELRSFISQCVENQKPVIPVLLPGVKNIPQELLFLKELGLVSFSRSTDDSDALDALQWGITGEKTGRMA